MTAIQRVDDAQIQRDVFAELRWDADVREAEVGVQVDGGIVTLTGAVDSLGKKLAAAEAAHRVAGVRDVANDLSVQLPGDPAHSDTAIAQAVRHALEWDVLVPHEQITCTVDSGIVTLAGTVRTWRERDDAGRAVRRLTGVCDLVNRIEVTPHPAESTQVRRAIEAALARQAILDAAHIHVLVQDGHVTLSGKVRCWSAKEAVLAAASHAPGIREVEDHLRIEPLA